MSENKKVVYITGCLGFIGSYVTQECINRGWYVMGIDKLTYASQPHLIEKFSSYPNFKFEKTDICDIDRLIDCDYFINTAAETHVDNSIRRSEDFLHSNIDGVYNILELLREYKRKDTTLIHFSCYDDKTKALTKEGLKSYDQIKINDEVLSINPNTGNTEFKKVKNIIIQDYDGEMIHFKNKSDDIMVTPNHRMYYIKNGKIEWDEASKVCNSSNKLYPRGVKQGITSDVYVDNIGTVSAKDLFYVSGVFIGDGFTAHQIKKVKNLSGLSKSEYLKKNRGISGKFIKNRNVGSNEYSTCNSYRIFFDVPEKDKARKKLETSLTNLGIKWYAEKNKSGEHIYFSSKEWIEYFLQFGKYAHNKKIPMWMFDYDHSILKELYYGLIDSDGYWNKSKTGSLTTVSYDLVQTACLLGNCLGYHMKFKSYNRKDKISIFPDGHQIKSQKKSYVVFFNTKNIRCGNKYIKIKYSGKIWCLTVEDNKNFVVERNGLLKISGNTDETYGDILNGAHLESDILNPSNPYSATKAAADQLILAWARTYEIPYVILRPTNNYGIGQYAEKLIPKTCKFLQLGRKIPLHDNGTPIRNWLHAQDTARAVITIIDANAKNEIYNIAGGFEQSNIKTVEKIIKEYFGYLPDDYKDKYLDFSIKRPGQDIRYSLNDNKIKALGWMPRCVFDKEIKNIVAHYKNTFIW